MKQEGPPLEVLLRRLVDCPPEFIETCASSNGLAQLTAIACDHFRAMDCEPGPGELKAFEAVMAKQSSNLFALTAVTCWLLHDEWLRQRPEFAGPMWHLLGCQRLQQLAQLVQADRFTSDPDRREELARTVLASLNLRPAGESILQASDRLTTLDSVERVKVLRKSAAAEKRAREVREAMARAKAMESASRYGE
jgi:hypothetical protein